MAYKKTRGLNKLQKQINECLKREEQNVRALKKIFLEVGKLEAESRMLRASESGLQKILDTKRTKNPRHWSPEDVEKLSESSAEGQRMRERWMGLELPEEQEATKIEELNDTQKQADLDERRRHWEQGLEDLRADIKETGFKNWPAKRIHGRELNLKDLGE